MGDFSNMAARSSAVGVSWYEYWMPTLEYRLQTQGHMTGRVTEQLAS